MASPTPFQSLKEDHVVARVTIHHSIQLKDLDPATGALYVENKALLQRIDELEADLRFVKEATKDSAALARAAENAKAYADLRRRFDDLEKSHAGCQPGGRSR